MKATSVFMTHNSQAVFLPQEVRFNDTIKKVFIRKQGEERILCSVENTWDSFFLSENKVTEDFLIERAEQTESIKEEF